VTKDTVKAVDKVMLNENLIDANDIHDLCKSVSKNCVFDPKIEEASENPNSFKILKAL